MNKKYLTLNDIDAYNISLDLANYVWDIIIDWDWFAKKTVGAQMVTSIDSVSANIAEGFGRYNKKDKIRFYRYAQGSLRECKDWNSKSHYRKLMSNDQIIHISENIELLAPAINRLIKFTNDKLKY